MKKVSCIFSSLIFIIAAAMCLSPSLWAATASVNVAVNGGAVVSTVNGNFETCNNNNSGSVSLYRDGGYLCSSSGSGAASCSYTLDRLCTP